MFIRDCWYVAAWSDELSNDGLLARTIAGEQLLFMRKQDGGGIAVLQDRCCHRQAPLSMGQREGDTVRCMYHGLKFAVDGRCVEIPGQEKIPSKACVRTYPVQEKNSWIWVWMGDPALADAQPIPESVGLEHPDWRLRNGRLHYQANYQFILDNLLDFSHLTYVHQQSFGGNDKWGQLQPEVSRLENGVRIRWTIPNIPPAPFARNFGSGDLNVDLINSYDFVLPGVLLLSSEVRARDPKATRPVLEQRSCQAVTPETETTSHYFFSYGPHASYATTELIDGMFAGATTAFEEDRQIIERQQKNLDAKQPFISITADIALVQFRRLIEQRQQQQT